MIAMRACHSESRSGRLIQHSPDRAHGGLCHPATKEGGAPVERRGLYSMMAVITNTASTTGVRGVRSRVGN